MGGGSIKKLRFFILASKRSRRCHVVTAKKKTNPKKWDQTVTDLIYSIMLL
jgi:hypothetical protein